MVWNVDLDEFSGGTLCPSMHDVHYPLLTALNDALTSTHSLPTTSSTVPQSVFAPRLLRVIITRIYELPWIKGCCHTTISGVTKSQICYCYSKGCQIFHQVL